MRGFIFLSGLLTIALWGTSVLAQSSVLVTSGMGSGASSTARLSAILQQQVKKVNAIEACGNNGKIYGKSFPLVDVNDCVATFSTSSDANESIVQILDFVTARHKFAPLSRELTVNGNIIATGTLTASTPTAGGEVTTKDYVDTAVAAAIASVGSSTTTTARSCHYIRTTDACGYGFDKMTGAAVFGSGQQHNICCSSGDIGDPEGYFVATNDTYNGNALGGLSGADAKCLTDLTTYDWKGKTEAQAAGILTASNVKAWLCDTANGCQNLKSGRNYAFAVSNSPIYGGYTFKAPYGGASLPPGGPWNEDAGKFPAMNSYFWAGRNASGATSGFPSSFNCDGWVVVSTATVGHMSSLNATVWNTTTQACGSNNKLICMVHPD